MELIKLRVYNVGDKGSININPKLIETVIVSPYNDKYILILALSQGARYQLATSEGKYLFDTKEEAEAELNTILEEVTSASGVDLNPIAYFNYAGSFYGDKYSLLVSAWEHSLTVDPLEISQNSSYDSPRGKAQYPNGETEGVIIPQGVTTIGDFAFWGWESNNQPLVIPNSVTSIGKYAFVYWPSNNQPLVIPNSVTSIGEAAFSGWSSNNHPLVIPNSVTSIGMAAFDGWASNNQPLVIPNSVTSIGAYAFDSWSSNNQPLVIPNSVTSIGEDAFYGWQSVPYVEILAITPPTIASSYVFDGQNNAPIYVPDESVDDYKEATNWVDLADRIFPISDKVVSDSGLSDRVDTHIEDLNNPHAVTAEQVGAYSKQEMNSKLEELEIDGGFL